MDEASPRGCFWENTTFTWGFFNEPNWVFLQLTASGVWNNMRFFRESTASTTGLSTEAGTGSTQSIFPREAKIYSFVLTLEKFTNMNRLCIKVVVSRVLWFPVFSLTSQPWSSQTKFNWRTPSIMPKLTGVNDKGSSWCHSQSTYRDRVEIGGVYLHSQLERSPQLCTWW